MDIDKLIKYATLDKVSSTKEAYRSIKAEILLNNSSKNPKPNGKIVNSILFSRNNEDFTVEVNELELSILKKLIKEKEEQISMYEANSRKDLADMYREQLNVFKVFLPPEVSRDKIQEAVVGLRPYGFQKKEMGSLIKEIKEIYPTADGKLISEIVKEYVV